MKVYSISANQERVTESLVESAKRIARQRLPIPATTDNRYGVGFLVVHDGAEADYVFVDWWTDRDIVQHHCYGAPKGHGGELTYGWPPGAGFCVWELAVYWFERQAWVDLVLDRPKAADLRAYLERQLNAYV